MRAEGINPLDANEHEKLCDGCGGTFDPFFTPMWRLIFDMAVLELCFECWVELKEELQ